VVGIAVLTVAYFVLLEAVVLWVATFSTVRRARVRNVRMAQYVVGVLLLGFIVALLLRVPVLAVALLALVLFGLRDPRIRETLVRWWDEIREAQAQRRWVSSANDGQDLGPGVRYTLRAAGGYVYFGSKCGKWVTAHPEHAVLVLGPAP
jgi:hypothetical protein